MPSLTCAGCRYTNADQPKDHQYHEQNHRHLFVSRRVEQTPTDSNHDYLLKVFPAQAKPTVRLESNPKFQTDHSPTTQRTARPEKRRSATESVKRSRQLLTWFTPRAEKHISMRPPTTPAIQVLAVMGHRHHAVVDIVTHAMFGLTSKYFLNLANFFH
jgi:hypothetical protein